MPGTAEPTPGERAERRSFLVAGAVMVGVVVVLVLGALAVGVLRDDAVSPATTVACGSDDAACLAARRAAERPGIIPEPTEGRAPEDPGEPGGAAQLTLLAGLLGALTLIVVLVVRSARRARSS